MPSETLDHRTIATRTIRALAAPHRYRVALDGEEYAVLAGRFGQVEYHDVDRLAVWTDRRRLFAKLWAIPGAERWQTGDLEARVLFPVEALEQVADVVQVRRRRPAGTSDHLARFQFGPAYKADSRPQDDEAGVPPTGGLGDSGNACFPSSRPRLPSSPTGPPTGSAPSRRPVVTEPAPGPGAARGLMVVPGRIRSAVAATPTEPGAPARRCPTRGKT